MSGMDGRVWGHAGKQGLDNLLIHVAAKQRQSAGCHAWLLLHVVAPHWSTYSHTTN